MRHVVHGLDADLIMLALATHEPHFCILRELVLDKRKQKAKEEAGDKGPTPFCLCKIWVLREYLHKEFVTADWNMVPGGYDLEKVIDDFVFMCFFVGNDFLPHLPAIEIRDGAIDMLIYAYKMLLPKLQARRARRTRRTPHTPHAALGSTATHSTLITEIAPAGRQRWGGGQAQGGRGRHISPVTLGLAV